MTRTYDRAAAALKITVILALAGLQAFLALQAVRGAGGFWEHGRRLALLVSLFVVFDVVVGESRSQEKLTWAVLVLLLPVCGCLCYILWGRGRVPAWLRKSAARMEAGTAVLLKQDPKVLEELAGKAAGSQAFLAWNTGGFPVYKNTRAVCFFDGEEMFEAIKSELLKAKRFIFMECPVLAEGLALSEIMDILEAKAAEGVETRLLFDPLGARGFSTREFMGRCAALGIFCAAEGAAAAYRRVSSRDSRRIVVVDGNAAFAGGVSICGGYAGEDGSPGCRKAAGVLLRGDAVWSLTVLYLTMWDEAAACESDASVYRPTLGYLEETGFVTPVGGVPDREHGPAACLCLKIISQARDYVYIQTPCLPDDPDFLAALRLAALSGADVRVITSPAAERPFTQAVSRALYEGLLAVGVRIYEYAPGFMNAETVCADDSVCFIGSVASGFGPPARRFSCGVWMHNNDAVPALREDFLETMAVSEEAAPGRGGFTARLRRVRWAFTRFAAPFIQ